MERRTDYGPSWFDVNQTLTELKRTHQRFIAIEINQTSPSQGYPELYVRVVSWLGYKDGYRQHERAKGHQFPTREARSVPALIYRLLIELDVELTAAMTQAEQQAQF